MRLDPYLLYKRYITGVPFLARGKVVQNTLYRLYSIAFAAMAELADALDSGSSRGNSVDVQIILAAKTL